MGSGGGSSKSTSTVNTKAEPWSGVKPYLSDLYYSASQTPAQQYYYGSTVAPTTQQTTDSWNWLGGWAKDFAPYLAGKTENALFNQYNATDVANNPYVQAMNAANLGTMRTGYQQQMGDYSNMLSQQLGQGTTALGQSLEDQRRDYNRMLANTGKQFNEQIMPGITNDALGAESYGGTRQALAQKFAMDSYNQNLEQQMRDITRQQDRGYQSFATNMGNAYQQAATGARDMFQSNQNSLANMLAQTGLGAYGQGLTAQGNAISQAKNVADLGMLGANVLGSVGKDQEAYNQRAIDADIARWDFGQNAPWMRYANLSNLYGGASPYSSSSSSSRAPQPQANPFATAAGVGSLGYGIYNMMG
jgi:hypothetical protein